MVVLFCISALFLLHSYILYPVILWAIAGIATKKPLMQYSLEDELPVISILVAAHNEEAVIGKKIRSIFQTTYPISKIEVIIGSDSSTDNTSSIVRSLENEFTNLKLIEFPDRQGKVNIVNQLVDIAKGEIVISTDANVFLEKNTLFELVRFMKDPDVGLVDSRMVNTGLNRTGISFQESVYITHEVMVKYREGMLWGTMIGPFGGCYAIRKELFVKPPSNFLVDDFYINMRVIEQGKKSLNNLEARVYEDVSNDLCEEFRRKIRIAQGNFQNLAALSKMLWPPFSAVSFAFLSHKVIRWFGPILIIFALLSSGVLAINSSIFLTFFLVQVGLLALPVVDFSLKSIGLHVLPLRFATHFVSMNIALFVGLTKYLKGVQSNVWQPTRRYQ